MDGAGEAPMSTARTDFRLPPCVVFPLWPRGRRLVRVPRWSDSSFWTANHRAAATAPGIGAFRGACRWKSLACESSDREPHES